VEPLRGAQTTDAAEWPGYRAWPPFPPISIETANV